LQNPFIGNGVDPQNTSSSPPQSLGLLGQFTKLYASTNGAFGLQLAIGGWTWSTNFSLAVRTASSRSSLAQSIVTLFQQWPVFKGVSIDWEYLSGNGINYGNTGNVVSPNDPANFVLFVQTLRQMFNQNGWTRHVIALCCTSAPEKLQFDVASLVPLLDEWHVMTYEYSAFRFLHLTVVSLMAPGLMSLDINRT
jgi:chitinase